MPLVPYIDVVPNSDDIVSTSPLSVTVTVPAVRDNSVYVRDQIAFIRAKYAENPDYFKPSGVVDWGEY